MINDKMKMSKRNYTKYSIIKKKQIKLSLMEEKA